LPPTNNNFFTFATSSPSFGNFFTFVWQLLHFRLATSSPSFGSNACYLPPTNYNIFFTFIWLHEILGIFYLARTRQIHKVLYNGTCAS